MDNDQKHALIYIVLSKIAYSFNIISEPIVFSRAIANDRKANWESASRLCRESLFLEIVFEKCSKDEHAKDNGDSNGVKMQVVSKIIYLK